MLYVKRISARCLSCRPPWPSPLGKARARAATEEPCAARAAAALPAAAERPWGRPAVRAAVRAAGAALGSGAAAAGVPPAAAAGAAAGGAGAGAERGQLAPGGGLPGPGRRRLQAISRTKDSPAAGASFLSAPTTVRDWRPCAAAAAPSRAARWRWRSCPAVRAPRRAWLLPLQLNRPRPPRLQVRAAPRLQQLQPLPRPYRRRGDWGVSPLTEKDNPPLSKAGQDAILSPPTDGAVLDDGESTDDHAIVQYEWTLLQGYPSVDMKSCSLAFLQFLHHISAQAWTIMV
ncbi:low-density lipoprotein receptor-related protein 11-like [Neovison vison]|uniref:low-density lipoprotein receptor-related protein 11-like n=1 Tax=Neovison vison TaxID=452646 RepID=UPI001CF0A6E6|nr:low-density lipoprotein receptor-related protein 11-like [Neogale vison]